ncbi:MAG: radical SAM protein [Bosea sp.]|uniref:4Fe-4S single cluster domain-containing protein n=1 Tax=Bosea sp. (in: a-proteobacteria) TaxID=1871050 RepID=UPI00238529B5|nr:radical SAM protein [Bosea sp. (in: a-proteobacteria)]MCP4733064.1 radical SAM protein [Bosea sp. (in: a-proteobacteria)]
MNLQISRTHFPVTVLGPGCRAGIWVQGCGVGCKGCVSKDTWNRAGGSAMPVATILSWSLACVASGADGVTISGGEPFEQPDGLAALLDGLIAARAAGSRDFDILCYSGLKLTRLRRLHAAILAKLDAVIPEPFVEALPDGAIWRGSVNQPLIALSERGRRIYAPYLDGKATNSAGLQVSVEGDQIWMVGIPRRGDLARLEAKARAAGLQLGEASWM